MSFILDALRKAELLRGKAPVSTVGDHVFGDIAAADSFVTSHKSFLFTAVAVGLAVTIAVAWWLGSRSNDNRPDTLPATNTAAAVALPANNDNREIRPLDDVVQRGSPRRTPVSAPDEPAPVTAGSVVVSDTPLSATPTTQTKQPVPSTRAATPNNALSQRPVSSLPGYVDLKLSGRVDLPNLHLDIHVYSETPARRFVFINNRKYREGEKLDEGGSVEQITAAGVVLNYRGHRFELLPD